MRSDDHCEMDKQSRTEARAPTFHATHVLERFVHSPFGLAMERKFIGRLNSILATSLSRHSPTDGRGLRFLRFRSIRGGDDFCMSPFPGVMLQRTIQRTMSAAHHALTPLMVCKCACK